MKLPKIQIALIIVLVQSAISCGQAITSPCEKFKEYSKITKSYEYSKDTVFLINKLNAIISTDSFCVDAYLTRANLFFLLDSVDYALKDYRKVLVLDSGNVYSLYRTGMIYQEQEKDDMAVIFFQKALDLKKSGNTIINYSADGITGKDDKSKYDVQAEDLMYAQGLSFYYLRKLDSALLNFNFCISNNYFLSKSYLHRGAVYLEMKKDKQACDDFVKASELGNAEALKLRKQYCNE